MASPTQRTLEELRRLGHVAGVVERWIPQTRRRLDLFGFIDIVALGPWGTIGIQCTTSANQAARRTKIITECSAAARRWLEAGNRIQIWAWSKKGPRGKRKTWQVTITEITIEEFRPRRKVGICGLRRAAPVD